MTAMPTTLGERYVLREVLGTGATSTVYRAQDLVLGRDVAVKILSNEPDDADARRRFVREAQTAARFRHASAVAIYAFSDVREHPPYLVMELVTAPTLDARIASGPLPVAAAIAIGEVLADVLSLAHAQGLVHRDIKPANVFVEGGPVPTRVWLGDFGLAFASEPDHATLGRLTQDDHILGSPSYMAPEQIERGEVGPASDVYALCATLYETLSGRPPFVGDSLATILAAHRFLPPIPLGDIGTLEPIPSGLERAIASGLAKRPAERPDAATLAVLLREHSIERGRSVRPQAEPARVDVDHTMRVWTSDPELNQALKAAGVLVGQPADVELVIAEGEIPAAGNVPSIALCRTPTPTWIAAAIRAGHRAGARWPGDVMTILRRAGHVSRRAGG